MRKSFIRPLQRKRQHRARGTRWAFSVTGSAHWLHCEAGRPNRTPSRKNGGPVGPRWHRAGQQQLEHDSNVNGKSCKGRTQDSPETENLILLLTPQAAKGDVLYTKPQSALPDHSPALASPGRAGSALCGYTAGGSHFPAPVHPRESKGTVVSLGET